jgi:hypothetical protein
MFGEEREDVGQACSEAKNHGQDSKPKINPRLAKERFPNSITIAIQHFAILHRIEGLVQENVSQQRCRRFGASKAYHCP